MSSGRIVQIIGAVIDVEFPRDQVPNVYDALLVDKQGLTLEVQQQLGDGVEGQRLNNRGAHGWL